MGFTLKTPSGTSSSNDAKPKQAAPQGFLKTGASAKAMMEKADAEREAAKSGANRSFRFWMKEGEDAQITFLDGKIDPNTGILDIPYAVEHGVKINGRFEQIVCLEDQGEPCPLCMADNKKAFVGYLTVLDHRTYVDKNGKAHQHNRKLYVAKSDTLKQLTKLAEKMPNGLVGTTFDVSRTGDKKPNVGDIIIPQTTHEWHDIVDEFKENAAPLNYNEEAPYMTAAQMIDIGIGKQVATIGGTKKLGAKAEDIDTDKAPW